MKRVIYAFITAVFALMSAISIALAIIHSTNFIYKIDIEALNIPENSGYSKEAIEDNVSAVMHYLSPFNTEEFDLPGLEYSEGGAVHFADCKVIFTAIYIMGAVSVVAFAVMSMIFKPGKKTMRMASIFTLALPVVVMSAMAIDFDATFILFHELLFTNSHWMFYAELDPIIKILPAEFFMHCAIFIACMIILACVVMWFAGKETEKTENDKGAGNE